MIICVRTNHKIIFNKKTVWNSLPLLEVKTLVRIRGFCWRLCLRSGETSQTLSGTRPSSQRVNGLKGIEAKNISLVINLTDVVNFLSLPIFCR